MTEQNDIVVKSWRCGEEAMRQRVLAEIRHRQWLAAYCGKPVDLDEIVNRIEAIPLTEASK